MVTRDDESRNVYTLPIGQCNQLTTFEESKFEKKCKSALINPGEYISKQEPSKISEKKTMVLYIVPGALTLFYQQGNHNTCILLYLASSFCHMVDGYASKYIIKHEKKYLLVIQNK